MAHYKIYKDIWTQDKELNDRDNLEIELFAHGNPDILGIKINNEMTKKKKKNHNPPPSRKTTQIKRKQTQ